jgi:predicted alpha/beta superfamily hydrolase
MILIERGRHPTGQPMPDATWLLFIVASLVISAKPGQDMILVMSRSTAQGAAAALRCCATAGLLALVAAAATAQTSAAMAQPSVGRVERIASLASRHVDARHIDVWLPADYTPTRRYQVLYMHDGQNLYDGALNWTKKSWQADVAVDKLVRAGRIADTIIVGIWNNGVDRYAEYYPEKVLALAPEAARREYVQEASNGRSRADAYLRFIVDELKPLIDARYATRPGPESTFVVGSSMGGLIAFYALCEYPQVFGAAAGLSSHWVGRPTAWGRERVRNAALPLAAMTYLSQHLPPAGRHRLYTDRGDDWLDSLYAPTHGFVGELFRDRGYGPADAQTVIVPGTGHSEADWAARLDRVLLFLMAPSR